MINSLKIKERIEPISSENIGKLYFSIEDSCEIIGIKKTSLYSKYLNDDNLNIKRYSIKNSKKVFLYIDDIENIKSIIENGKVIEGRISSPIDIKEKDINRNYEENSNPYKDELNKLRCDYEIANNMLKSYLEAIEMMRKDKEQLNSALEKSQALLSREQELNAKDKNTIASLTEQLKENKVKLLAATEEEASLKATLIAKEEYEIELKNNLNLEIEKNKNLENEINNIKNKSLIGIIKYKLFNR